MTAGNAPSRLLPRPVPPHDPLSLLLAGHIGGAPDVGWRVEQAQQVEIDSRTQSLVLAPGPASARWLTEPGGTLGGVRLPANVVATAAGDVILLDRTTGALQRFDACACRFARVPCTTRVVAAAADHALAHHAFIPHGDLSDPQAIAACGGDLVIADRGHARLVRLALGTWVPRGTLRLPGHQRASLAGGRWQPAGLASRPDGSLLVTDPVNGRLDVFDRRGRWRHVVAVPIGAGAVAVDVAGSIYVVVGATLTSPLPAGPDVRVVQLDAGRATFHWHSLRMSPLPIGSRLVVDVQAGDDTWPASHLADPANGQWVRWLGHDQAPQLLSPMPLSGVFGRYLRVRVTHAPGSPQAAADIVATGAWAVRVDGDTVTPLPSPRANRVGPFDALRVAVDASGQLHLHCQDGVQVFDGRGGHVESAARSSAVFAREGRYLSSALDSGIEECQWHRVELRGAIPAGCSVEVRTVCAALALTPAELAVLPDDVWSQPVVASAMEPRRDGTPGEQAWDCLVGGLRGRYLWLKLTLRGDARRTPCLTSVLVEYPRISLRRYLPGVFSVDPAGADFTDRLTGVFDRTLRSIEGELDTFSRLLDPRAAPAEAAAGGIDFLSWLGRWIGAGVSRDWPVERRRHFLTQLAALYPKRGTPEGLRRQLLLLLGFDVAYGDRCRAVRPQTRCASNGRPCGPVRERAAAEPPPLLLEHFKLRRWLYAGRGRLGADAVLWGKRIVNRSELSGAGAHPTGNAQVGTTRLDTVPDPLRDPFHVHAHRFSVFVPARVRENPLERRALEQLVAGESPAHTEADIQYVEPRFRVGVQATIGLDAVVARTPGGVTLDRSRLRQGTVLTGRRAGPHLEVGKTRVGSTTRLT